MASGEPLATLQVEVAQAVAGSAAPFQLGLTLESCESEQLPLLVYNVLELVVGSSRAPDAHRDLMQRLLELVLNAAGVDSGAVQARVSAFCFPHVDHDGAQVAMDTIDDEWRSGTAVETQPTTLHVQVDAGNASSTAPARVPGGERAVLMSLFEATNGAAWEQNFGWGGPDSVCEWYGIECVNISTQEPRHSTPNRYSLAVGAVLLSQNGLIGRLQPGLAQLTHLSRLDLSSNELAGTLPTEWSSLVALQQLYLQYNKLTGTLPTEWSSLVALQGLSLASNKLTGTLPTEWSSLGALQQLSLQYNELTGRLPTEWSSLVALKRLLLFSNVVTGELPTEWSSLVALQQLSLQDNELTGPLPTEWSSLVALRLLFLASNELTGPLPTEWSSLMTLEMLLLYSNKLTGTLPTEWSSLIALDGLWLFKNQLTGALPTEWSSLVALEVLDLSDNELTGPLPTEWSSLMALEQLWLHDNELTGPLPTEWSSLVALRFALSLFSNKLTGTLPTEWSSLVALERLHLQSNNVTGMLPIEWSSLVSLQELYVARNGLVGVGGLPSHNGSLVDLDLDFNAISALPASLSALPFLRKLRLRGNPLGSLHNILLPLAHRTFDEACMPPNRRPPSCTGLELLDLSYSSVSGTIPSIILALSGEVKLRGCNRLSGVLPSGRVFFTYLNFEYSPPGRLAELDLSGVVGLHSSIPDEFIIDSMRVINTTGTALTLSGNSFRAHHSNLVFAAESASVQRRGSSKPASCPQIHTRWGGRVWASPTYYHWKECSCRVDDVGVDAMCHACPIGAVCPGGNGNLLARPAFWCDAEVFLNGDPMERCEFCAPSYCCPGPDPCDLEHQCADNRVGVLCGECRAQHSVALGGTGCLDEADGCSAARWLVPFVLVATSLAVTFVVLRRVKDSQPVNRSKLFQFGSARTLLVFFYQIIPLVNVGLEDANTGGVIAVITGVLNLNADTVSGAGTRGLCFAPGLTSVSKAALGFSLPLLLLSWTAVVGIVQWGRGHWCHIGDSSGHGPSNHRQWHKGVTKATVLSLNFGYSTLLKTTLSLLHCVDVDTHGAVLLLSGNVHCYTRWQQGLFVVTALLVIYPAVFALWLHQQIKSSDFEGSYVQQLVAPFVQNRRLWPAVLFTERLLLVTIFSFTPTRERPWALFFSLMVLFGAHLHARPYRDFSLNLFDLMLLGLLVAMAALSTTGTLYLLEGGNDVDNKLVPFKATASAFTLGPVCVLGAAMLTTFFRSSRQANAGTIDPEETRTGMKVEVELGTVSLAPNDYGFDLATELIPPLTQEDAADAVLC